MTVAEALKQVKYTYWDFKEWLDENVWESDLLLVNNVYINKKMLLQNIRTDTYLELKFDGERWSIREMDTNRILRVELL